MVITWACVYEIEAAWSAYLAFCPIFLAVNGYFPVWTFSHQASCTCFVDFIDPLHRDMRFFSHPYFDEIECLSTKRQLMVLWKCIFINKKKLTHSTHYRHRLRIDSQILSLNSEYLVCKKKKHNECEPKGKLCSI